AAAALKREHALAASAIRAVRVRSFREAVELSTRRPAGTDAAQYSLPFPVAALLVRGKVSAAEIGEEGLRDPEILRLAELVELIEEPRYSALFPAERWADVEIETADGRMLRSGPAVARGSAENPLSDAEISSKFHELLAVSGFGERASPIEDLVMSLEKEPSMASLFNLIYEPAEAAELQGAANRTPNRADGAAATEGTAGAAAPLRNCRAGGLKIPGRPWRYSRPIRWRPFMRPRCTYWRISASR